MKTLYAIRFIFLTIVSTLSFCVGDNEPLLVPLPVLPVSQKLIVPLSHGGGVSVNQGVNRAGIADVSFRKSEYSEPYQPTYSKEPDYFQLLLPALAITGLSLLFPNIITISRKKRDLSGEFLLNFNLCSYPIDFISGSL